MEFLGTIDGITSEGHAVIKCAELPDIGADVFDSRKNRVGKVSRVFGPVNSPYASVTPIKGAKVADGKQLYFERKGNDDKAKRRNRRN